MKKTLATLLAVVLTGCAAPTIDWSAANQSCSSHCTDNYSRCSGGFSMTPFITQANCNDALKVCAASCGGKVVMN